MPSFELVKVSSGDIIVAQKTLARLEDRIVNARESIYLLPSELPWKHILLIDDAAGSGATFNETAKKLKQKQSRIQTITAFALVGSYKGFDVIREV